MLHLHSLLRWIVLILLLLAVYQSLVNRHKAFTGGQRKTGLFLMIACDVMLLVGLYQWVTGPLGLKNIQNIGFKDVMSSAYYRFYAVEHTTGMLIAIILVHLGYAYAKKELPDAQKQKRTLFYFGLALLIILISIPWPFRAIGENRAWFPGM